MAKAWPPRLAKAKKTGAVVAGMVGLGKLDRFLRNLDKTTAAKSAPELLPPPITRDRINTAPQNGTIFVDSKGNAIPAPLGGSITGSPDGRYIQARDANGNPTGVRIDGGHSPKTHTDPRALGPHGHVPGVTNADGTPWLPIKQ